MAVARRLGGRTVGAAHKQLLRRALFYLLASLGPVQTAIAQASLPEPVPAPSGENWTRVRPTYLDPFGMTWSDGNWWWTAFGGVVATTYATEIARGKIDLGQTYIVGATIGREYGALGEWFRLEWEISASFQFGKEEIGDFRFYPVTIRFIAFPWNDHVLTTFAMGYGASWMTSTSRYEKRDNHKTARANAALFAELTFALPERPDWALMLRLHHRSPIFGLLKDRGVSADFLTIGVKHRF